MKNNSSILLSIFKRKGGEGCLTKIVNDNNKKDYKAQLTQLINNEEALVLYKQDELNWLLLTNVRVIQENEGALFSLDYSKLLQVNIALQEEFDERILNKQEFTLLWIKDNNNEKYLIKIERGAPFQGVYQILHYIASNNKKG